MTAFTPGPNNIILSTTAVKYGFNKAVPQIIGIFFGFLSFLALCLFGIGKIFLIYPSLYWVIKILASIFLLYLSYKIFTSKNFSDAKEHKPLTLTQIYFFQIINPKGVMVSISAASLFLEGQFSYQLEFIIIFLCFAFSTFSSAITWAMVGHLFRKITNDQKKIIIFNKVMAVALVGCIVLIIV
ncbi:LysE family translocator [Alphaproteobacteria bacterium]|nr:LysE family translocator [Alphaproteobacteria bacterium]